MKKLSISSRLDRPRRVNANDIKLTPRLKTELQQKNRPDTAINLTDMPEVKDWSNAQRGLFFRPIKQPISLRVDTDVLEWFRSMTAKYQSQMNKALREYMEQNKVP